MEGGADKIDEHRNKADAPKAQWEKILLCHGHIQVVGVLINIDYGDFFTSLFQSIIIHY